MGQHRSEGMKVLREPDNGTHPAGVGVEVPGWRISLSFVGRGNVYERPLARCPMTGLLQGQKRGPLRRVDLVETLGNQGLSTSQGGVMAQEVEPQDDEPSFGGAYDNTAEGHG